MTSGINNKGFSLITVIILSLMMFLIGGTGLYIATTNFRATRADINLNVAEKASNAGLMAAFNQINMAGSDEHNKTISSTTGDASYLSSIEYGGKNVWFVSSTGSVNGNLQKTKVVKTAIFQGYYGVGLYTVRGRVNARISGARLSGCDASPTPACYVPAFIASGTIDTGNATSHACIDNNGLPLTSAVNGSSAGLYGSPGTLNLDQGDLSKIFFKVKCFNKYNNKNCSASLLDYLEYDYGWNSAHTSQEMSFQQTDTGANGLGIPVVSVPAIPSWKIPGVSGRCVFPVSGALFGRILDLANDLKNCNEIVLNSALTTVTITGMAATRMVDGKSVPVIIYTNGSNNQPIFSGASNFIFYKTNLPFTVSNSSNFTIYSTNEGTFSHTNSNFTLYTSGKNTLTGTNSNFALYTTEVTNLSGTVTGTAANPFRIISTKTINTAAGILMRNGTIITGPVAVVDINDNTAPQNLVADGDITVDNVNIFARRLEFGDNSTVNIWNSLIYVYAFACPNCSRTTSTSSLDACVSDKNWCGYYGREISLNLGRDPADAAAKPIIFISNNTAVKTDTAGKTEYIWGVWYGEDVTYLRWLGSNSVDVKGFMIRNFPPPTPSSPSLSLNIILTNKFTFNFSKPVIDTISNKYRFIRKVECVHDPLTPKAQLIQTRLTGY